MLITDFEFNLPEELIAQTPLEDRENSRMLVVDRAEKTHRDSHFQNFAEFLRAGDVLVLNNTKVFPARLGGATETGANVEIFLVKELENQIWETLARPARRLKTGKQIIFAEDLIGKVVEKSEEGRVFVQFEANGDFDSILDRIGKTPLPPYIKRARRKIRQRPRALSNRFRQTARSDRRADRRAAFHAGNSARNKTAASP
jgi:S-adenosylmethionine:tRNA ribosyltransferase-isomerase